MISLKKVVVVSGVAALALTSAALFFPSGDPELEHTIVPTHTVALEGVSVRVAIADTPSLRERGLSGISNLKRNEGMLFIFEEDDIHSFWMKDMLFPIDILWLAADTSVVHIEHSAMPESFPHAFTPPTPARYVLETVAGFATEHKIEVGSKLEF